MHAHSSRLAMAAVLAVGFLALATPADAQRQGRQGEAAQQGQAAAPALKLSKEEVAALQPIEQAIAANDFATAKAGLATAQPVIKGADARYMYDNFQFRIGTATKDNALLAAGLEGLLASGKLPPANQPAIYKALIQAQTELGQADKAEATLAKYLAENPNDPDGYVIQAQARMSQKRIPDALTSLDKAIELQKASGKAVPESWLRIGARNASAARLGPQAARLGQEWVRAYPDPKNWREVLTNIREATQDRDMELDVYRLQRAVRALIGDADYVEYTRALSNSGYPGEIKSVLDEAAASKAIDGKSARFKPVMTSTNTRVAADKPTLPGEEKKALAAASGAPLVNVANAYFGYGDYAKAADLYRAALKKGSVDANIVNTRLGMALALSGQKAEAESAFKAIAGNRSELAGYLLIWLSQRA